MKFHASDLHDVISLQNKYRKLSDFRYSTVRGSNPARSKRFLFFFGGGGCKTPILARGLPIRLVKGCQGSFPAVKRPRLLQLPST